MQRRDHFNPDLKYMYTKETIIKNKKWQSNAEEKQWAIEQR